ncbi:hypothetical protein ACFXAE_00560 [Streptomyces sp. NPDC059454]|uniref:hypothetical protein n=1 Tax=Streptomyces sp. NPDC059454 TaxID=3346836 RepID=UPI00367C5D6E
MSSSDDVRTAAGEPTPTAAGRNRAAKISAFLALGEVAFLADFATGIAWINPGIFVGLAMLCALIAVPAGHVGRFRSRRTGGTGAGRLWRAGWCCASVRPRCWPSWGLVTGLAVLT